MDTPLEIVFHNMPSSPTLEGDIRKRVGKLDRLYEHLIGCRVSVEQLHRRHQTGNLYDVHIDMRVPGNEIAVSHEPVSRYATRSRPPSGAFSTSSASSAAT
jgi:ribosome-associated translation inhibitor RaiA